jgi:hypothetical protein
MVSINYKLRKNGNCFFCKINAIIMGGIVAVITVLKPPFAFLIRDDAT